MLFQTKFRIARPEDLDFYMLFFHNKGQMYLPNPTKLFGSEYLTMDLPYGSDSGEAGKYLYFRQDFRLSQIRWKAVDQESLRCEDKPEKHPTQNGTVTDCIVSYLESEVGCSMGLQGHQQGLNRFGNTFQCKTLRIIDNTLYT